MTMAREHQLDSQRLGDIDIAAPESQHEDSMRYAGGAVPAVHHGGGGAGGAHTASEMGYLLAANTEDPREAELKAKVGKLCDARFGGDYKKAFAHYDGDHDGLISKDELSELLSDAGVGNRITRGAWASGIIKKLDKNADEKISWAEFDAVFQSGGGGTQRA
jgi:hypothetical protein